MRFSVGMAPDRDIWPPRLLDVFWKNFDQDRQQARAFLRQFVGDEYPETLVNRAGLIDGYHGRSARWLLQNAGIQVLLVYLPGIDILFRPPRGVLLIRGDRVAVPGPRAVPVSWLDVAPTILALSGFPKARDLPGEPILDFLDPTQRARLGNEIINTFGDPDAPLAQDPRDPMNKEILDRLRSLGYIR